MPEANSIPIVSLTAILAPGGLAIRVTSPVFEQFFSTLNGARPHSNRELYGGASYYEFDNRFDDFTSGDIHGWGERRLLIDGKPNVSILRAVGLTNGVDITVQTVLNKRQMEEYFRAFEEAALDFYDQYIRAERYELVITAEFSTERR